MNQSRFVLCLLAALLLSMTCTFAADQNKQPTPEEMQKMMELWQKVATPGAPHAAMAKMAGDWTSHMKMWMDPKAPPSESDGTTTGKMLMDGRYLESEHQGTMMGMPFQGIGLLGFDNNRQRYQYTWIDNMGTVITTADGPASDGKTITLDGKMDEPTTGEKDKPFRYVFKLTDDDHYTMEGYDLVGTPQEFKVIEVAFTRKK